MRGFGRAEDSEASLAVANVAKAPALGAAPERQVVTDAGR